MASPVSDDAFARAVQQAGVVAYDELEAARAAQAESAKNGAKPSLAEVLVQQGVITDKIRQNIEKKLHAQAAGGLRQLGQYKLLKKLGEGGMGAVYLAEDLNIGRQVAIKVLPKKYADNPEFVSRFRREAKAAGALNHVNIVAAYTVSEDQGYHYLAMEYCDGEPLDKFLKRSRFVPEDLALQVVMQVARGLEHAHGHGIIHRDIKPGNIFLTRENVAKILDLGLSKDTRSDEHSFQTVTGVALGTPHYISPEQAKGEKNFDGRTDIYSLGATLYHMVTGETPFHASTAAAIMLKHLNEQLPNPQDLNPDLSDGTVHIITKMMAKDPSDRYANCGELLTDLELVIDGKEPGSAAPDATRSSVAVARVARQRLPSATPRQAAGSDVVKPASQGFDILDDAIPRKGMGKPPRGNARPEIAKPEGHPAPVGRVPTPEQRVRGAASAPPSSGAEATPSPHGGEGRGTQEEERGALGAPGRRALYVGFGVAAVIVGTALALVLGRGRPPAREGSARGQMREQITVLEESLRAHPEEDRIRSQLAVLLEESLRARPEEDRVRSQLAVLLNNLADHLYKKGDLAEPRKLNAQIVDLYGNRKDGQGLTSKSAEMLARGYGNLGWLDILDKDFKKSIVNSSNGLGIDKSQNWIRSNLAEAYLYDGQFQKAKELYLEAQAAAADKKAFYEDTVAEFEILRKKGISHPDVERVVELLSRYAMGQVSSQERSPDGGREATNGLPKLRVKHKSVAGDAKALAEALAPGWAPGADPNSWESGIAVPPSILPKAGLDDVFADVNPDLSHGIRIQGHALAAAETENKPTEYSRKNGELLIEETEWASMGGERVKALLAAADESEKEGKAAEAAKLRNEAATVSGKIADQHKTTADNAYPKFVSAYKAYKAFMDDNLGKIPMPQIPPNILNPIDEWVVADKRYVVAKAEQLDCYDANAPECKQLSAELAKLCQSRAEWITDEKIPYPWNEAIAFPTLVSFYCLFQARALAAVEMEDKATAAWKAALSQGMLNPTPEQVNQMKAVQWSVLNDLVMMKIKLKKNADAVNILEEAFMNPKYQPFFDTDGGKAMLLRFADAQVAQPRATAENWERAIGRLRDALVKEPPRSQWANEFSRKIGELLIGGRAKNARPRLPASAWFDAAHGLFLDAQAQLLIYAENKDSKKERDVERAQEAYAQAAENYRNALFYYREVIRKVRSPDADIVERLQLEPKSWFEMGLAYVNMEDYLEACITYQALRNNFLPDYRANWMPKPEYFSQKCYPKALEDALADLDKPKDGLLARGTRNLQIVVDENIRVHKSPWHAQLRASVQAELASVTGGLKIDNEKVRSDTDYLAAIVDMEAAGSLVQQAKAVKDTVASEQLYTQALRKYVAAAERYQKVSKTSSAYGLSLYQAGSCYALAEGFWSTGRFPNKKVEEVTREAPPLARKAVDCFQGYEDYIGKNPTNSEEEQTLRRQLRGMITLARSCLFSTLAREAQEAYAKKPEDKTLKQEVVRMWTEVVNVADALTKTGFGGGQDVALLNKFRALIELSTKHVAPDCEPFLVEAEETMCRLRVLRPKDNALYVFMLNALTSRYLIASYQAADPKTHLGNAKVDAYGAKAGELQSTRVTMIEEDPTEVSTLDDYTCVFYFFYRVGRKRRAVDWAVERILKKFDPEGKCARIPDNDKHGWQALLARMEQVCKYDDLNKWQRAKTDHAVLIDLMYDTPEGLAYAENSEKRPADDKYNQDLDKAAAQVKTIEKNYPDCRTLDPQYGQNKVSLVGMVADEFDFRRKLRAVRELVMTLALKMAGALEQDAATRDQAQKYKELALEQAKVLGVDPAVPGATEKTEEQNK